MMAKTPWHRISTSQRQSEGGMLRSIAIFAGVRVKNTEALVDTAAEDAVIGEKALASLKEVLQTFGLRSVRVPVDGQAPCAGIGGEGKLIALEDVPVSVAGIHGLLRFNVLQDNAFSTPPLLPISFLEAMGAVIDLRHNQLWTYDGYSATMERLPSGHRSIDIFDFRQKPWRLPQEHQVQGQDPFQMPVQPSHVLAVTAPETQSDVDPVLESQEASPSPDLTELSLDNPQVHIFVQDHNTDERQRDGLRFVATLPGWRERLVCPTDVLELQQYRLSPHRSTLAVDAQGHVQRVNDLWNAPQAGRPLTRRWQGVVTFYLYESPRTTILGDESRDDGAEGGDGDGQDQSDPAGTHGDGDQFAASSPGGQGQEVEACAKTSSNRPMEWLALSNAEEVESWARRLREESRFTFEDLENLLLSLKASRGGRGSKRGSWNSETGTNAFSMTFGAYAHGSQYGYTKNTERFPELAMYLTAWFRHHAPSVPFSSVAVSHDMQSRLHRDVHNSGKSLNVTTSVGRYSGGSLWIEQKEVSQSGDHVEQHPITSRKTPQGLWVPGTLHNTRHRLHTFSPKLWHGVQGWKGKRISVTAYTIRNLEILSATTVERLRVWGFPLAYGELSHSMSCLPVSIGEIEDGEDVGKQCEFDLEGVFDEVPLGAGHTKFLHSVDSMFKRMSMWTWCSKRRPRSLFPATHQHVAPGSRGEAGGEGEFRSSGSGIFIAESEDGPDEVRSDLEKDRNSPTGDLGHGSTTDGGRLLRGSGERELRGEGEFAPQGQSSGQKAQDRTHPSGHREATQSIQGTEVVRHGAGSLQSSTRQASLSGELVEPVVDVRELREPLGEERQGGGDEREAAGDDRDRAQGEGRLVGSRNKGTKWCPWIRGGDRGPLEHRRHLPCLQHLQRRPCRRRLARRQRLASSLLDFEQGKGQRPPIGPNRWRVSRLAVATRNGTKWRCSTRRIECKPSEPSAEVSDRSQSSETRGKLGSSATFAVAIFQRLGTKNLVGARDLGQTWLDGGVSRIPRQPQRCSCVGSRQSTLVGRM